MNKKAPRKSMTSLPTMSKLKVFILILLFLILAAPTIGLATGADASSNSSPGKWPVFLQPLLNQDRQSSKNIQLILYRRCGRNFVKEYQGIIYPEDLTDGTYNVEVPINAIAGSRYYDSYLLYIRIGESLHAGQVLQSAGENSRINSSPIHFYGVVGQQGSRNTGKVEDPMEHRIELSWAAKFLLSFLSHAPPPPSVVRIGGISPTLSGGGSRFSTVRRKIPEISFSVGAVVYRYQIQQNEWPYLSPSPEPNIGDFRAVKICVHNWKKDKEENDHVTGYREYMAPVKREVRFGNDPMRLSIEILLEGRLTAEERNRGLSTEFPVKGFEIADLERNGEKVTIRFRDPLFRSSGGAMRAGILRGQIQKTLLQFEGVEEVEILPKTILQP
ncbi:MAG: GerMN domain-containing protein [Candidatus Bipolaricaulota bacterium]